MKGELCVLHKIALREPTGGEKQFVVVACDSRCPKHGKR